MDPALLRLHWTPLFYMHKKYAHKWDIASFKYPNQHWSRHEMRTEFQLPVLWWKALQMGHVLHFFLITLEKFRQCPEASPGLDTAVKWLAVCDKTDCSVRACQMDVLAGRFTVSEACKPVAHHMSVKLVRPDWKACVSPSYPFLLPEPLSSQF